MFRHISCGESPSPMNLMMCSQSPEKFETKASSLEHQETAYIQQPLSPQTTDSLSSGSKVSALDSQYVILYHAETDSLYFSSSGSSPTKRAARKISDGSCLQIQPVKLSPSTRLDSLLATMMSVCFLRWLLTVLHAAICLLSGACCVFTLVGTLFSESCLPKLVDKSGLPMQYEHGFSILCESAVYGLIAISAISFLSCLTASCCVKKTCTLFISFLLTILMGAVSLFGGAIFTAHNLLWCDSVSHSVARYGSASIGCTEAARQFDQYYKATNMTAFQNQMQTQQILCWSLLPLAFITVVAYALALRSDSRRPPDGYEEIRDPSAAEGLYQYIATFMARRSEDARVNYDGDEQEPLISNPT